MKLKSTKPYEVDSSQLEGRVKKILLPKTIEELQKIVKKEKELTIRGGATGLAGGAVPTTDIVLDVSKIDKIISFDKKRKIVIVEAGLILDDLQDFLLEYNLEFPINPSSHSICTIGGMIAANAVGNRAIKYGKTSDWILWIDIVNSKGEIERKTKTELSDFVGKEGITGVIVQAGLKLSEIVDRVPSLEKFSSIEELISRVKKLRQDSKITMIEYLDKNVSNLIGLSKDYYLFTEIESNEKLNEGQKKLYEIRDKIYPALSGEGFTRIEDPKIILDKIPPLLEWLDKNNIPTYGHISVGIVHPCFSKEQEKLISEMMKLVKRLGGQISGEHGIGILKKEFLDISDKKILLAMKKRLDPKNKFNPGKII